MRRLRERKEVLIGPVFQGTGPLLSRPSSFFKNVLLMQTVQPANTLVFD